MKLVEMTDDNDAYIGYYCKAKQKDVNFVLSQKVDDDGRSGWKWFRLANGDLILGVFPRGETYEDVTMNA